MDCLCLFVVLCARLLFMVVLFRCLLGLVVICLVCFDCDCICKLIVL